MDISTLSPPYLPFGVLILTFMQSIVSSSHPTLFNDCIHDVKHATNVSLKKKSMSTPKSFTSNHHRRPFCKWNIDFMTCHPASSNGHKYIVVELYYFTKWVKAIASFKTTADTTMHFVFNHVITRFRIPLQLVFDHGKQFENEIFAEISSKLVFSQKFASPHYLQSNG
jgi:hypothetical protein